MSKNPREEYYLGKKYCIINVGKKLNNTEVCNFLRYKMLINECIENIKK